MKNKLLVLAAIIFGSLTFSESANAQVEVPFDITGFGSDLVLESSAEFKARLDAEDKLEAFMDLVTLLGGGEPQAVEYEINEGSAWHELGWGFFGEWRKKGVVLFETEPDWTLLFLLISPPVN